jgi:tetratricopeptide (TPR) repeat protein
LGGLLQAAPDDDYRRGIALYKAGDFRGAAQAWESARSAGAEDWRLYFNLGNAHARLNEPARAVLNYERALRLAPKEPRIRENLEFVRLRLKDRFPETGQGFTVRILDTLYNLLSTSGLAVLVLVLVLLLNGLWAAVQLTANPVRRAPLTLAASLALAALLLAGPLLAVRVYREQAVVRGVVMAPSVTASSAPQADATDLFVVHEGTTVRLWETVEGWQRITLPNGLTGFVPQDSIERI